MFDSIRKPARKSLFAVCLLSCSTAVAQQPTRPVESQPSVTTASRQYASLPSVGMATLQCVGYFRMPVLNNLPQIVGGEQEQEKTIYAGGDYVYLDSGARQGITVGQRFQIIRPRSGPSKAYRQKKGYLGVFIQEIGELQVVRVKQDVSVAQITFSCGSAQLGDFLTGVPDRFVPEPRTEVSFDRFADPSGKPIGRVMMTRDGRETLATGDVIYVDLGAEDNAAPGDYLTIFREVGTGNLNVPVYDLASQAHDGFASDRYRGGELSIQAPRARQLKGEEGLFRQSSVTSSQIKSKRPTTPRKIVGEAMIINLQVRTATAVVMNVAQEVHTGDFVEIR